MDTHQIIRTTRYFCDYVVASHQACSKRHAWDDGAGPASDMTVTHANHYLALVGLLKDLGLLETAQEWHAGETDIADELVWVRVTRTGSAV